MDAIYKRLFWGFILTVLILLASCTPEASFPSAVAAAPKVAWVMVTADPKSTLTPTPFQPMAPTFTPLPTSTPTVTPTPTETLVPTEEPLVFPDASKQILNLLVMGSDKRQDAGYRTDVIMLISIHADDNSIRVVSFPRDLYVTIPGYGMNRINTAMVEGGFPLLSQVFEENFHVHPDKYILANFQGVVDIIDDVDGVFVQVEKPLYDQCDLPQRDGNGKCKVKPGTVRMDGKTVLWYVRSRHTTSDFDRMRRTQEVMKALFSRLFQPDSLRKIPEFYNLFKQDVETNLTLEDALPYIPVAIHLQDSNNIRRYVIGPGQVWDYIVPESGAWVLWPNLPAVNEIVNQAVYGP